MGAETDVFYYRVALGAIGLSTICLITLIVTIPAVVFQSNIERDNVISKSLAFKVSVL